MRVFNTLILSLFFFGGTLAFADHHGGGGAKKTEEKKLNVTGMVHWEGTGIGKSHPGTLKIQSGEINLKGRDIVSGNITIDMKSLDTPDGARLKNHLKSADFFEVENHPVATFVITKSETLKKPGSKGETHRLTGDLTIKENKHPITFLAKVQKEGDAYKATAETAIEDRTQFGINYNSGRLFDPVALGDKLIHDRIKIRLALEGK